MITGNCGEIKCELTFELRNGLNFSLNTSDEINRKNYVNAVKVHEQLSGNTDMPVGVVSSRVLDITLTSNDNELVPENESSSFYGYLDNTVKVHIKIYKDNNETSFGTFYVDTWRSNITDRTPNQVVIEATCIMSKIMKMDVPLTDISNIDNFADYLLELFDAINIELNDTLGDTVRLNEDLINFGAFPSMQYACLKMDDMGTLLNDIAQSTLTNIFIDRQGYLRTDFCCDDSAQDGQYLLSIMTSAQVGEDNSTSFDGIKAKYSKYTISDIHSIASVNDEVITSGDNEITDISLGDNVYKINAIEVVAKQYNTIVSVNRAVYNKSKMNLYLNSDGDTLANINIYAQDITGTELIREIGGSNKLDVSNTVLDWNYIDKYLELLLQLISIKNNMLTVSGYFTPELELSDTVYIDCNGAMNVGGYYKIQSLDWEFSTYPKCTVNGIKTFTLDEMSVDIILASQIHALTSSIIGVRVSPSINNITEAENTYVESQIGDSLAELKNTVEGGV